MKVRITERPHWLAKIEAAISGIEKQRSEENSQYEAEWAAKYDARPHIRWLIGPLTRTPPKSGPYYPSIYAWGTLSDLYRLKAAISVDQADEFYLTDRDIKTIG